MEFFNISMIALGTLGGSAGGGLFFGEIGFIVGAIFGGVILGYFSKRLQKINQH